MGRMKSRPQIKSIWGLAKSKEVNLTEEELYSIIICETGKDSMRELTTKEINRVITVLIRLKENNRARPGMSTPEQIYKIKTLEKALGWEDNSKRLEGFIKKFYKVEKLEWLEFNDAVKLIESLKKVLARENKRKVMQNE